jgi:hypothetical protein
MLYVGCVNDFCFLILPGIIRDPFELGMLIVIEEFYNST